MYKGTKHRNKTLCERRHTTLNELLEGFSLCNNEFITPPEVAAAKHFTVFLHHSHEFDPKKLTKPSPSVHFQTVKWALSVVFSYWSVLITH